MGACDPTRDLEEARGIAALLPAPDPSGKAPVWRRFRGAAMVADASGFTAFAAAMEAEHGARGADRLAARMTELLGAAADIVTAHGGVVTDLVGDAVQAIWPDLDEGPPGCLARAEAAAAELRARIAQAPEAGRMALRVGIGAGEILVAILGGHEGRWDTLAWGSALARAADLEAALDEAQPGEADDEGAPSLAPAAAADRSLVLPNALRGLSPAAAIAWSGELRVISTLFCRLAPPGAAIDIDAVHQAVRRVQRTAAAYDGVLDKVVADEKGVAAIVAFGLPPSQMEGAAERAVMTALALAASAPSASIGIATGKLFLGVVGGRAHGQYTMYGPAANRAARLMSLASAAPLCDGATRDGAAGAAAFAPRRVRLKGLGEIDSFALSGAVESAQPVGPPRLGETWALVGRDDAKAACARLLDRSGDVRLLALAGGIGLGKSALMDEAIALARAGGRPVLAAPPARHGVRAPLSAWRGHARAALRGWAHEQGLTEDQALSALAVEIGAVADYAALANPLFRANLAPSARLARIADEDRPIEARRLQAALLSRLVGPGALIVLDDADRADEASLALAEEMLRADPAARLALTARDERARATAALIDRAGAAALCIELKPLDRDGTWRLAQGFVPVAPDHPMIDWLHARCRGNPQLARELLAGLPPDALADAAHAPGAWRDALPRLGLAELPATIEAAIMARIARQSVPVQALLKAASVAGGRFDAQTLAALGLPGEAEEIQASLEALAADGLLIPDAGRYAFAQELARATVHANLPDAMRRDLHRLAAQTLQSARRPDRAAELARHWREAGHPRRAVRHAVRAGLEAQAAGAHGDAAAFFRDCLADDDAGGLAGRLTPLRRARIHSDLSHALSSLGDGAAAIHHARAALAPWRPDLPTTPAGWRRFLLHEATRLAWTITRGGGRKASARARYAAALQFRAAYKLSDTLAFTAGANAAVAMSLYSARQAEAVGDLASAARPYGFLGYAAGLMRIGPISRFFFARPRAHAIAARNWPALQFSLGGELWLAMAFGQWQQAERLSRITGRLGRRANSDVGLPFHLILKGQQELYTGRTRQALVTFGRMKEVATALGNDQFLAWCAVSFGRCHLALGDPAAARAELEAGRRLLDRSPDPTTALMIAGDLAAALTRLGLAHEVDVDALMAQFEDQSAWHFGAWSSGHGVAEAVIARAAGAPPGQASARVRRLLAALGRYARLYPLGGPVLAFHRGAAAAQRGDWARATRCWRAGARQARRLGLRMEEARLYDALAAAPRVPPAERARHRASADKIAAACQAAIPPRPHEVLTDAPTARADPATADLAAAVPADGLPTAHLLP